MNHLPENTEQVMKGEIDHGEKSSKKNENVGMYKMCRTMSCCHAMY